jgi:hypothetical protein
LVIAARNDPPAIAAREPKMDEQEQERVTNWVRMYAQDYLGDVSPALVTDAELSKAVRLRWFDVRISGVLYKVGLNIHYGGAFGAL